MDGFVTKCLVVYTRAKEGRCVFVATRRILCLCCVRLISECYRERKQSKTHFFSLSFASSTLFLTSLLTYGPEKSLQLLTRCNLLMKSFLQPRLICILQPVVVLKAIRKSQNREKKMNLYTLCNSVRGITTRQTGCGKQPASQNTF